MYKVDLILENAHLHLGDSLTGHKNLKELTDFIKESVPSVQIN